MKRADDLLADVLPLMAPPPDLLVSEWSDRYRILSSASAEPGKWRTDRAPYLREIMDSVNDPSVKEVWWMKSAQVGATEALNNICAYFIDQDPGPILVMQPTVEMGESWSKDRFQPMCRDSPHLRSKVKENKSRDSGNTILHKNFDGGTLDIAGANSPAGLASRPKRIVLCDEVDRYPASAGAEGDPVKLAQKRSTTYWNRVFFACSTPTVKRLSRIERGFLAGDQRRYHLPCPHCGGFQHLVWERLDFSGKGTSDNPLYICEHCEIPIEHHHKAKMLTLGKWVAHAESKWIRSYHINELYSPWSTWEKVVTDFLDAKRFGPEAIKTWKNTSLGETYEETGQSYDAEAVMARAQGDSENLDPKVLLLTAGVDVQRDRLEIEIVGWGDGEESWSIDYKVLHGDPKQAKIWSDLDTLISTKYTGGLAVVSYGVDSGDGNTADDVMAYCRARSKGRIGPLPMKGSSKFDAPIWTRPKLNKNNLPGPWVVGSSQIKIRIYDMLKSEPGNPGYMHFPEGRSEQYYKGLTAEKLVTRHSKGWPVREWHKIRERNEPLDCRVYAYAAMKILNPNWQAIKEKKEKTGTTQKITEDKRKKSKKKMRLSSIV